MASGEDRWDVFLAHASPDKPRARLLHRALTELGLRVFLDEESLAPGDDWTVEIPKALRASDVIVVLVSPSTSSAHYEGEELPIAIARAGDTRVVPIHLAADLDAPYGFARLNRIDWEDEGDLDSVVARLRRVVPRAVRGEATGASIFSRRIPVPPRHFTGRERLLERVTAHLADRRTTTLTQTIQGMGGVGKTSLAAALCDAQRDHYDVVWWVRSEEPGTLVADLAELADAVGVTSGQGGHADAEAAVRWLEETDRLWLLVFDDVPDLDTVAPWIPARGDGAAILTSRFRHMDALGPVEPIDLLTSAEAARFLRDRVARASSEDLEPVLDRIGGLPLALEQAAAWVDRKPNRTFARWVELFDHAGEAFSERLAGYAHTAESTWRVSIDAATEESPFAEPLLNALGHFAPEGIDIQWLRDAAGDPYLDAAPADVDAAIDALDTYDLVTITPADTIDIHRIVHDVARRTAPAEAGPFAVRALVAQDPGGYAHGAWPHLSALAPHARQAADVLIDGRMQGDAGLVNLLSRIAVVACDHGEAEAAIETATVAVRAAQVAVPQSASSLIADDALARARQLVGSARDAIPLLERVLEDSVRILGADHPDTLTSRSNLAIAHTTVGDHMKAIPLLESTLADRERVFGRDHPATLQSCVNLARSYQYSGETERAITVLEAAAADYQRTMGPLHPETLAAQNGLASAYLAAGQAERAVPIEEATLTQLQQVFGSSHPQTLTSRNNLAILYHGSGRLDLALPLLEETLTERKAVLGPHHPDALATQHNLGAVLLAVGDPARAADLLDQTFQVRRRILGPSHPATIASQDARAAAQRLLTGDESSVEGGPPSDTNPKS